MKNAPRHFLAIAITCILAVGTVLAQEQRGSNAEAKQMVQQAVDHIKDVGPAKAFEDFSTPGGKWHNKDIYLFCYKMDGTNVCHGANKALIGKNLFDLKTADGQFLIRGLIDIAQAKGSGWIDYQWPHPQTKKTESKRAYVMKIPGYDGLVGAGCYPK
jgi:signal transduction histidine kinase